MNKQEYKDIYDVVGAAMEVHKILGRGLNLCIKKHLLWKWVTEA